MSGIVKHTQLREVSEALWNKVKTNFITDVTYNPVDRTLNKTKNNQYEEITKVVTEWKDLDYTTQSSIKNIFDKNTQVTENRYYFVNNGFYNSTDWCMATIPCGSEKQFTIVKMSSHDSGHIAFLDEHNSVLGGVNASSYATVSGKTVYKITIPSNLTDVAYFTVNLHKQTVTPDQVMVFSGHIENSDIPINYVPFTDGATVLVYSNEVALSFDGTGTNLSSSTIHSAIKELNKKIVNAGSGTVTRVNGVTPDNQGHVTVELQHIPTVQTALNLKMNTTDADNKFIPKTDAIDASTGQADTGKVVKLNSNGQISASMIPAIAITSVRKYNLPQDALDAANRGDLHIGDVVVLTGDGNRVYMYADTSGNSFNDKFIELHLGVGTIRTIGGQIPNGVGDIELLFRYGADAWELSANGTRITSIETMTSAEKQDIINLFV